MSFDLQDIFKVLAFPKKEGRPPTSAKVISIFGKDEFLQAVKYFGNLRLTPKTLEIERTVYFDGETFCIAEEKINNP